MISSIECYNIITNFCKEKNANIEIEEAQESASFLMMYSINKNKIFYNIKSIIKHYNYFSFSILIEEFIIVALCHELGHYKSTRHNEKGMPVFLKEYYNEDFSFKISEDTIIEKNKFVKMKDESERLGWQYGLYYIPLNLLETYKKLASIYKYNLD
jgi:hypothetical protein